jgi:hypothetical protein
MTIVIDDPKFQQILEVTLGEQPISVEEIRAILQLVQLAASTDLDDDPAEWGVLRTVTARLCARGGIAPDSVPVLSPMPTDDDERATRIARLVPRLTTTGARDLRSAGRERNVVELHGYLLLTRTVPGAKTVRAARNFA